MKPKSSKQKKIRNRNQRKSFKRKKKTHHSQNGGEIVAFQLYFFTEHEITEPTKSQLMDMLIELYGANISYTGDSEINDIICNSEIREFVHKKEGKYKQKKQTLGFSVNTFPAGLKGDMNDDKLTCEESKIQMALGQKNLPFKLVDTPPGLWSPELAIIAFENIKIQNT
jgi:hypothetical protein